MKKQKLVVIGNGMAGVRAVEEILAIHPDRFEITIFGKEPHPNYNRILLSKVLQGDTSVESITLNDWSWYEAHQITLYTGEPVMHIQTDQKVVVTAKDRIVPYDELIIATGSLPFMLPLPGAKKEGVTAFRDIYDCEKMVETSKKYKKAIVIGGGLLGLEAARGLLNLGMQVDVVHIGDYIMDRQLDPMAASLLQKELEAQGMNFLLQKNSAEITGHKRVKGLRFSDGSWREADLIVMAVGVRPNTAVAAGTDIEVNRAIVVDDYMRTNIPNVYAVGECAEHRGLVYGLVAPLYEQGKALAAALCEKQHPGYQGSVLSTQLKVSGVDVFSSGEFMDSDETQSLQWFDGVKKTYKKIVIRDQKVAGAVLFGDITEGARLLGMIQQKTDYAVLEKELNSGSGDKDERIASMADHDIVCACNGVSKGTIVGAICEQGLQSVDDIKACTKASSSCGGCRPVVTDILDFIQRNGADEGKRKEAICACAEADHAEIIEAVQLFPNESLQQIMERLDWKTASGCETCRPALHYYMGMYSRQQPEIEEVQQPDGTYMAAPRLYGGITGAHQLRIIADAIETYKIPLAKLADGPRMELYGIKKQDIAAVRAALSITAPSYGNELVAVGTCAGIQYTKDAFQDSINLGKQLEEELESFSFPARLTIAISSGLRDDAKSLQADVGLIGAPGGWELYVAGERLYSVMKEAEAIRMTIALLSYYRDSSFYGESVGVWLDRFGVTSVREEVLTRKGSYTELKNKQAAAAF
ncbi:nitrite reductase large subunit NirB [Domibacillus enclensis]|uniref:Nitrite reductase (NADH) large subunit n=1 Tax=Domibacillus enclensis TaxID=1017273 RepID=A0A1N6Z3X9_9BACI|nr:nitrite reductase large subunit NirB [Domibacillus enclensis]OXS76581.1 nitrite reductase large subunit [Domibacillus enclensis]SIR21523.1 nitrite reductase (NADH) large subunit [Domibacillus enclensis]